jgi:1,4-dihydroxy-2-naphthoate octaprenyltransferase
VATVGGTLEQPRGWRVWWLAARPHTLTVAVAPVLVGTAIALADGVVRPIRALAALAAALLITIGTNLANDLSDHERGADGPDRTGPPRAMQMGWLSREEMRGGIALVFGAAALIGLYLVVVGGWPVALAGLLSIAAGITYTGGPFPFGYRGMGDPAVFVFFGLVAVGGTYYVQAGALSAGAIAAAVPVGCLATAILVANNVRDLETDQRAAKHTLAVWLGPRRARQEYLLLVVVAYASLPLLWALGAPAAVAIAALTLPRGLGLARLVNASEAGGDLNATLAATARLQLTFSGLLAIGWLL